MRKKNKKGKDHTIYAIYDSVNDELVAVGLDQSMLEFQLQLNGELSDRFSIVEFDIRLST